MDLDENPLYREMIALLGLNRVVGRIDPFVALPKLEGEFDLVTAHCICFQKLPSVDGQWREWGADAWRAFLNEVRGQLLRPGGTILLDFNPRGNGVHYSAEAAGFFRAQGARLFRSKVLLAGLSPEA